MALEHFLAQNRAAILERWNHLIVETYPPNTSRFLRRERDRFINPVGYTIFQEIGVLYEELLGEMDVDRISGSLENIMKIRSVQDFSPSEGVVFVLLLKKTIREKLGSEISHVRIFEEWSTLESKIDRMALLAFDIYMKCREKICEIRVNEAKAEREMAFRLLERMNVMKGEPEEGGDVNL
jgi:hypothetical protein